MEPAVRVHPDTKIYQLCLRPDQSLQTISTLKELIEKSV